MIHWIADSYTLTWVNSVMLLLFVRFHSWRKVKSVSKKINRFVYICTIFALEIFPFLYYPLIFFSSHWLYGINIDIVSHSCALSHRVNLTFIWSWQRCHLPFFIILFSYYGLTSTASSFSAAILILYLWKLAEGSNGIDIDVFSAR